MTLFDAISCRKSVRKYDPAPLDAQTLAGIANFANKATPLIPGIRTECAVAGGVSKGLSPSKATHYMAVYSEDKPNYLTNAGFVLQQTDLYFSSLGLGACWLGMAKPTETVRDGLGFVITLAFGRPAEPPHRALADFKRKSLADIADGGDPRLVYARLAPSAVNSQPWFFKCQDGGVHVYRQTLGFLKGKIYNKMNQIDIGIALCHMWLASEQLGHGFSFAVESGAPGVAGYQYVGTIR